MNRLYKLVLLLFLVSFSLVFDTNAQGFNSRNKYWAIGGALNAMNYVGELDPGPSFISPGIKFTRYNFGIDVLRRISPRIFVRGTFSVGRIKGDDFENSKYTYNGHDVFRKMRNLNFFSQIYELKGDVVIDLIEHRGKYQKRPDFVPFVFVGLAYFHHNPKTKMDGKTYDLRDMSTEGQGVVDGAPKKYSLNQIALPIGLGLRYKLSKQLDLSFEMGWRFTTTDYLDDVGGKYADKQKLYDAKGIEAVKLSDRSGEVLGDESLQPFIAAQGGAYSEVVGGQTITNIRPFGYAGSQRGDTKGRRDAYIITGVHLVYIIPTKVICPKFR